MISTFFSATSPIPSHALLAFLAVIVGGIQLWSTKGTQVHRYLGYFWVCLMLYVAISGFFISHIMTFGYFSHIHILSILTIVLLYRAVMHARKGDIKRHKLGMKLLYMLALLVTGAFTFLPGRLMHKVFFGV